MTKDQARRLLERVKAWPDARQADLAQIVELMEQQDNSPARLSEEQAAEVRRRMSDPDPKTTTLAEFNQHLKQHYGV